MFNFTNAYGMFPIPVDTENPVRWTILFSPGCCITSPAIPSSSTSVTCFPKSPSFLPLSNISWACSFDGWIPYSSRIDDMPCAPACFPTWNHLVLPTSSGLIGSYVSGLLSTPWVWIPDSWPNAFSPTIALFGWTCTPTVFELYLDVSYSNLVLMFVSYFLSIWRHCNPITSSSSDAFPALSPIPFIVTCAHCAPACIGQPEGGWARVIGSRLLGCT